MSTKRKIILWLAILLAVDALVLIYVFRRLPPADESPSPEMAQHEEHYREMTEAYPIASEVIPADPTAQLWMDRKAALLEAGYIEAWEIRMKHSLSGKGAVQDFFQAFQARFRGVECSVRDVKTDAPVVTVVARKSDFGPDGPIENFVAMYAPGR